MMQQLTTWSQLSLLAVIHDVESLKQSKAQTPASTAVKSGFSVGTWFCANKSRRTFFPSRWKDPGWCKQTVTRVFFASLRVSLFQQNWLQSKTRVVQCHSVITDEPGLSWAEEQMSEFTRRWEFNKSLFLFSHWKRFSWRHILANTTETFVPQINLNISTEEKKKNKNIKEKQRKSNNDLILKRKSGKKMKPNKGKTVEEQKKDRKKQHLKSFFAKG